MVNFLGRLLHYSWLLLIRGGEITHPALYINTALPRLTHILRRKGTMIELRVQSPNTTRVIRQQALTSIPTAGGIQIPPDPVGKCHRRSRVDTRNLTPAHWLKRVVGIIVRTRRCRMTSRTNRRTTLRGQRHGRPKAAQPQQHRDNKQRAADGNSKDGRDRRVAAGYDFLMRVGHAVYIERDDLDEEKALRDEPVQDRGRDQERGAIPVWEREVVG